MKKKHDLDARVAAELGLPPKKVREITTAFLSAFVDSLSDGEEIHLDGVGRFVMRSELGPAQPFRLTQGTLVKDERVGALKLQTARRFRVHFSKSDVLKRILRAKHGPQTEKKS